MEGRGTAGEDRAVLRLCGLIIFASLAVIALRRQPAVKAEADLAPYQSLFRDLGQPEQRLFREMQEGLLEAEMARAKQGTWPSPGALADQGIPPFAKEPGVDRQWSAPAEKRDLEYLGSSASLSILALIQEPDPRFGGDPATTPADEVHHKLPNGTILHVTIWLHPGAIQPATGSSLGFISRPYASGWRQVVIDPRAAVGLTP